MATAVKVPDDLFDKARIKSKVFKRSIAGQIEYWAKIGQMIEENPDLPLPFIQDLLTGREEIKAAHLYYVLKFAQEIFCSWIANVPFVGHEVVEPSVSFVDIFSGCSFDEYNDLQSNFEKKQQRFNSLRGMQINWFKVVTAFCSAVGMLTFVLILVSHHCILNG